MSLDVAIRTRRQRSDGNTSLTEMDIATLCKQEWSGRRIFEHRQKRWYVCGETNGIWECDETERTVWAAQRVCREKAPPHFQAAKKVKAVIELTKSDPAIAVTSDIFDRNAYLLGTPKGPVRLTTGKLLAPDPGLYITRSTSCCSRS